jgi:hypothetical protein
MKSINSGSAIRPARFSNGACCDYCSVIIASTPRHILEIATRRIACVCNACALLVHQSSEGRKLIPRDSRALNKLKMTDDLWENLGLPIGLAIFYRSSVARRVVAFYPGPGGPTESLLPLKSWQTLEDANPILSQLVPDVEALLVNRLQTAREYFVVPIDTCFTLMGLINLHWRGFSGGPQVLERLDQFFDKLKQLTTTASGPLVENTYPT